MFISTDILFLPQVLVIDIVKLQKYKPCFTNESFKWMNKFSLREFSVKFNLKLRLAR